MDKLKQLNELKNGECLVIVEGDKAFQGLFDEKLGVVFYTIPSHYKVKGYIQD